MKKQAIIAATVTFLFVTWILGTGIAAVSAAQPIAPTKIITDQASDQSHSLDYRLLNPQPLPPHVRTAWIG